MQVFGFNAVVHRLSGLLALLSVLACGGTTAEESLEARLLFALPTPAVLDVGVPATEAASKPGLSTTTSPLKAAAFFESTRSVGTDLNRLLKVVMTPIMKVVKSSAKASAARRLLWTADDAEGRTLLAAEAHDDGHISYTIALRGPAGGAFLPVVVGSATPDERGGQGAVWVDFDSDLSALTRGQVLVLYDFDTSGGDAMGPERTITLYTYDLEHPALSGKTLASSGDGRSGVYHFQGSRRAGVMVYDARDVDLTSEFTAPGGDGATPKIIPSTIISRWTDAGGRSDAYLLVPPKTAPFGDAVRVRASQCWNRPGFVRTFGETVVQRADGSSAVIGTIGSVAECAYATPAPAVLPDLAPAPPRPTLPPEALK